MNNKKLSVISSLVFFAFMAALVFPASAMGLTATANANLSVNLDTAAKANAEAQIDARVNALNDLQTRISQTQKISAANKAALDDSIQASLGNMASLKAKIDADTDNATLKADIQSITKSYRIYLLVMPQGRIIAAADRIMFIVGLMNDLSVKLQSRITAAQAAGQNVSSLNASLADMNAKSVDANVQATAAINEIINLQPDNGDKTIFASNQTALKDARSKIKLAITDLKTARQDAGNIVKALASMKASASMSATTTAQ